MKGKEDNQIMGCLIRTNWPTDHLFAIYWWQHGSIINYKLTSLRDTHITWPLLLQDENQDRQGQEKSTPDHRKILQLDAFTVTDPSTPEEKVHLFWWNYGRQEGRCIVIAPSSQIWFLLDKIDLFAVFSLCISDFLSCIPFVIVIMSLYITCHRSNIHTPVIIKDDD